MRKKRILVIFGTRPEAIKMCPIVKVLEKKNNMNCIVCVTGQHREILEHVLEKFHILPQYDLKIMKEEQTITSITIEILKKMENVFKDSRPDIVLVQGDTTSAFAAALVAFYNKIPVGHIEAGLRTYDRYNPFPEEMNRCLISRLSTLHFAPTKNSKNNLILESIKENIFVTGNTVIDAFQYTVNKEKQFSDEKLRRINLKNYRTILFTAHRRENIGLPLENMCKVLKKLVKEYVDIQVIYPMHPNPEVRKIVYKFLKGEERIYLMEPFNMEDMHNTMAKCHLVMTDSGGLQEEAPYFGIPVIVLRNETERIEAIEAGTAILGGTEEQKIYQITTKLLNDKKFYNSMAHSANPYGDGHASEIIVDILEQWLLK